MSRHVTSLRRRARPALLAALLLAPAASSARADEIPEPMPANQQSAVDRGLAWLATQQEANGKFKGSDNTAVTSVAIMAFLARGNTPGQGAYGQTINKAIDWILAQQRQDGLIATQRNNHSMYNHGASTVMLCEVYGMVDAERRAKIKDAVSRAVRVILDAQAIKKDANQRGGWRYLPDSRDSDISVTGWQLMALRGAANIGAAVPPDAITEGVDYIHRRAVQGGGFSYQANNDPNQARTGVGILSLELLGHHDDAAALAGGDYLLRNPLKNAGANFFYYAVYYCAQAANQLGGKYFPGIYHPLRDTLIASQHQDGSWPATGIEGQGGNSYATAMALLALEVPYHYLPLYQR